MTLRDAHIDSGRSKQLTRLFDAHIHMYPRTTDDYDAMSKAGIDVIVRPSFWLESPRTSVGIFKDNWEHMISFETQRTKEFGIENFVCISVKPKEANQRPLAIDAMKRYLDRERDTHMTVHLPHNNKPEEMKSIGTEHIIYIVQPIGEYLIP